MTKTIRHPARYNRKILPLFVELLGDVSFVFDPMAGTGERLLELQQMMPKTTFVGIELQPDWAAVSPGVVTQGNALALAMLTNTVKGALCSPPWANRQSDHHVALDASKRTTYQHCYGSVPLHPDNVGLLPWGEKYRTMMKGIWIEVYRVLQPGAPFVVDLKNHIRNGIEVDVVGWHRECLFGCGFELLETRFFETKGNGFGANGNQRVKQEVVFKFRKPL